MTARERRGERSHNEWGTNRGASSSSIDPYLFVFVVSMGAIGMCEFFAPAHVGVVPLTTLSCVVWSDHTLVDQVEWSFGVESS